MLQPITVSFSFPSNRIPNHKFTVAFAIAIAITITTTTTATFAVLRLANLELPVPPNHKSYNEIETLSTLRFGNRAKSIKNAVVRHTQMSTDALVARIRELSRPLEEANKSNAAIRAMMFVSERRTSPVLRSKMKLYS